MGTMGTFVDHVIRGSRTHHGFSVRTTDMDTIIIVSNGFVWLPYHNEGTVWIPYHKRYIGDPLYLGYQWVVVYITRLSFFLKGGGPLYRPLTLFHIGSGGEVRVIKGFI